MVNNSVTKRVVSTLSSLFVAVLAGSTLVACAQEAPMQPAEYANDPACAEVIVRLPKTVAGLQYRHTNAQATGAWGTPVGVELRCGIEPSGPTTDECVRVGDVDWIIDSTSVAPLYRFEAYGREPGLEVYVNSELASGTEAVMDLANVVQQLPQTRECISVSDTIPKE